jgi:16S rRNA (uracil1498-N3)-methyltransferase
MSNRFYVNCPLGPGPVAIQGPEAHHVAVVCRVRPDDAICLFNGDGREYPARVLAASKRQVLVEVLGVDSPDRELGFRLEVAAPLPKGDRGQFLVEKLTELGVTSYVPIRTRRSIIDPGDQKIEKLERRVIEASKQTGRNVLLRVKAPVDWQQYCRQTGLPSLRVMAVPGNWGDPPCLQGDRVIAVGPEGGFSEDEVACGRQTGWQVVDLGPRILRIETAALVLGAWAAGVIRLEY